jgi:hypothetical protein
VILFSQEEAGMPTGTNDRFFNIFKEFAVQRYGRERADLIEPALQELAASLAAVSDYPLELEEEPAFFS